MNYLLDTNVISELRKRDSRFPTVREWYWSVSDNSLHISVLTVGEIARGIARLKDRDKLQARRLSTWLTELLSIYDERVVPITQDVAMAWGKLNGKRTVPTIDGLLAATAKINNWTLVTRNTRDMPVGVKLLNPFEDNNQLS